jgi:hypothetical protein
VIVVGLVLRFTVPAGQASRKSAMARPSSGFVTELM